MTVIVPPIKSQGIKTKLVPWINEPACRSGLDLKAANWIEPFFGTGVVGMNAPIGGRRIVGDSNPHIIDFYKSVQDGAVTPQNMREYLQREGNLLEHSGDDGYEHYRLVKDRFNASHSPFDFIFHQEQALTG